MVQKREEQEIFSHPSDLNIIYTVSVIRQVISLDLNQRRCFPGASVVVF